MAAFNKAILVGNLCRDPLIKATTRGSSIAELSLAINSTWTDKTTNTKREDVCYVDVTLFGKMAELADQYLKKGSSVLISGRLSSQSWTDKETGAKRSKVLVIGEEMQFLSSRQQSSSREQQPAPSGEDFTGEFPSDEVPF